MARTITADGTAPSAETHGKGIADWSGWAYLPGIAFLVVGVLALTAPPLTSLAAGLYIGAMLLIAGAFALVGGLAHIRVRGGWLAALLGLISLVAGATIFYNPVAGAVSFVWVLGAWMIVSGICELGIAFSLPAGRGWLIFVGLADVALGLWATLMSPSQAFLFLGYFVGASLVYRGLWSLVFADDLRQIGRWADSIRV